MAEVHDRVICVAAALEHPSGRPSGGAVVRHATQNGLTLSRPEEFEWLTGSSIS